jgi:hypothetical protein
MFKKINTHCTVENGMMLVKQLIEEQRIRRNCVKPQTLWSDMSPVLSRGMAKLNFPITVAKYLPVTLGCVAFGTPRISPRVIVLFNKPN